MGVMVAPAVGPGGAGVQAVGGCQFTGRDVAELITPTSLPAEAAQVPSWVH